MESSAEDILLVENSRSLSFLAAFWAFLRFFWLGLSPHRLVPPYILGILRSAIPSNLGPLAKSKAYPSHWTNKINLLIHWRKNTRTIWVTLLTSATIQNCIKTSWFFFSKKAKHPAYNIFFKDNHWILLNYHLLLENDVALHLTKLKCFVSCLAEIGPMTLDEYITLLSNTYGKFGKYEPS